MVLVEGVPDSARAGDIVVYHGDRGEEAGTVAVPPGLLAWCTEGVERGQFVSLTQRRAVDGGGHEEPLAVLRAGDGRPDDGELDAMLSLAREEAHRLDG